MTSPTQTTETGPGTTSAASIAPQWGAFLAVWLFSAAILLAGAAPQIRLHSRGWRFAAAVIVAFLLQLGLVWLPGFPGLRARLEAAYERPRRVLVLGALLLAPYFVYAVGTGALRLVPALKLVGLAGVVLGVYGWLPVRQSIAGLAWQDLVVMTALAAPMYVGWFRDIWPVPVYLDVMARLLVIGLGAFAVLSLRPLDGVGYAWRLQTGDWLEGGKQFVFYAALALPLGFALRFIAWNPRQTSPLPVLFSFITIFLFIAVAEELFFRGMLQNLLEKSMGHALAARAVASALFGLSHIHHGFPNWRYVIMAALAGWFYGSAWRRRTSIVAASVTHALVDTVWFHWFSAR